MRHKKILRIILVFLLWMGITGTGLFVSYKLGLDSGKQGNIIVSQPATKQIDIKTIAVVNLDEGIIKEDRVVNYANDLIDFTNNNLVATSLEDARTGVEEGRYAGYVIIPAAFSQNVQSINEAPVESQIQYALCNHLSGQSGLEALGNIYLLMNSLNNNVSYMYVDSILNEFHLAQDDVEEILKNGKEVSAAVNGVTPQDISAKVEFPLEKQMDFSPSEVDVKGYTQKNSDLISEISKEYSDGYDKSKEEKDNLVNTADSLKDSISDTNSKLKDVNVEVDSEGKYVYDSELTELSNSLQEYNAGLSTSVNTIKETIEDTDSILNDSQTVIDDIKISYSDTIDQYNNNITNVINALTAEVTNGTYQLTVQADDLKSSIADQVDSGSVVITYAENKEKKYVLVNEEGEIDTNILYNMFEDLVKNDKIQYTSKSKLGITNSQAVSEKLKDIIPKFDKSIAYRRNENYEEEKTDEYQKLEESISTQLENLKNKLTTQSSVLEGFNSDGILEIDTEQILQGVKENVVDKLSDNAKNVAKSISDEYQKETDILSRFQSSLTAYNPFSYINQDAIQQKNAALNTSTSNLEKAISNKNSDDMEVMNTIYSQYGENIMMLRESLSSAVEDSNKSVEEGLKEAKDTLNVKNNRNEELLGNFIEKLPYTRNGSLGNYKIYKFIVNPFEGQDVSSKNTDFPKEETPISGKEDIVPKNAVNYAVFAIIGMLILVIVIAIIARKNHKKDDNYDL